MIPDPAAYRMASGEQTKRIGEPTSSALDQQAARKLAVGCPAAKVESTPGR